MVPDRHKDITLQMNVSLGITLLASIQAVNHLYRHSAPSTAGMLQLPASAAAAAVGQPAQSTRRRLVTSTAGNVPMSAPVLQDADHQSTRPASQPDDDDTGLIAAIVIVAIIAGFLLILLIYWVVRCKQKLRARCKQDALGSVMHGADPVLVVAPTDERHTRQPCAAVASTCRGTLDTSFHVLKCRLRTPISDVRRDYEHRLRPNYHYAMRVEFERVPLGPTDSADDARRAHNAALNRSQNVLPYDKNRLVLSRGGHVTDRTYINASHIRTLCHLPAVIVTQCPTQQTINEFWMMVWQCDVGSIVMLVPFAGRRYDGTVYWPQRTGARRVYSDVEVELVSTEWRAHYVLRRFRLHGWAGQCVVARYVSHWQLTRWATSSSLPHHPTQLLDLLRHVQTRHNVTSALVVHCTLGAGCSGIFLALDALSLEGRRTGQVDVLECVTLLCLERINLVSTFRQYRYIYHCLMELYDNQHDTCIPVSCYAFTHSNLVRQSSQSAGQCRLGHEFNSLALPCYGFTAARQHSTQVDCNANNNNSGSSGRVIAASDDSETIQSAYILDGYLTSRLYVIARRPARTAVEFWAAVLQQHARAVIVLRPLDQTAVRIPCQGACSSVSADFFLQCRQVRQHHAGTFRVYSLAVSRQNYVDGQAVFDGPSVRLYEFLAWPDNAQLPDVISVLRLVANVADWCRRHGHGRATLFQACSEMAAAAAVGEVDRAALLCTIWTVLDRVHMDNMVDVYSAARYVSSFVHTAFATFDQYKFIYSVIAEHVQRTDAGSTSAARPPDAPAQSTTPYWHVSAAASCNQLQTTHRATRPSTAHPRRRKLSAKKRAAPVAGKDRRKMSYKKASNEWERMIIKPDGTVVEVPEKQETGPKRTVRESHGRPSVEVARPQSPCYTVPVRKPSRRQRKPPRTAHKYVKCLTPSCHQPCSTDTSPGQVARKADSTDPVNRARKGIKKAVADRDLPTATVVHSQDARVSTTNATHIAQTRRNLQDMYSLVDDRTGSDIVKPLAYRSHAAADTSKQFASAFHSVPPRTRCKQVDGVRTAAMSNNTEKLELPMNAAGNVERVTSSKEAALAATSINGSHQSHARRMSRDIPVRDEHTPPLHADDMARRRSTVVYSERSAAKNCCPSAAEQPVSDASQSRRSSVVPQVPSLPGRSRKDKTYEELRTSNTLELGNAEQQMRAEEKTDRDNRLQCRDRQRGAATKLELESHDGTSDRQDSKAMSALTKQDSSLTKLHDCGCQENDALEANTVTAIGTTVPLETVKISETSKSEKPCKNSGAVESDGLTSQGVLLDDGQVVKYKKGKTRACRQKVHERCLQNKELAGVDAVKDSTQAINAQQPCRPSSEVSITKPINQAVDERKICRDKSAPDRQFIKPNKDEVYTRRSSVLRDSQTADLIKPCPQTPLMESTKTTDAAAALKEPISEPCRQNSKLATDVLIVSEKSSPNKEKSLDDRVALDPLETPPMSLSDYNAGIERLGELEDWESAYSGEDTWHRVHDAGVESLRKPTDSMIGQLSQASSFIIEERESDPDVSKQSLQQPSYTADVQQPTRASVEQATSLDPEGRRLLQEVEIQSHVSDSSASDQAGCSCPDTDKVESGVQQGIYTQSESMPVQTDIEMENTANELSSAANEPGSLPKKSVQQQLANQSDGNAPTSEQNKTSEQRLASGKRPHRGSETLATDQSAESTTKLVSKCRKAKLLNLFKQKKRSPCKNTIHPVSSMSLPSGTSQLSLPHSTQSQQLSDSESQQEPSNKHNSDKKSVDRRSSQAKAQVNESERSQCNDANPLDRQSESLLKDPELPENTETENWSAVSDVAAARRVQSDEHDVVTHRQSMSSQVLPHASEPAVDFLDYSPTVDSGMQPATANVTPVPVPQTVLEDNRRSLEWYSGNSNTVELASDPTTIRSGKIKTSRKDSGVHPPGANVKPQAVPRAVVEGSQASEWDMPDDSDTAELVPDAMIQTSRRDSGTQPVGANIKMPSVPETVLEDSLEWDSSDNSSADVAAERDVARTRGSGVQHHPDAVADAQSSSPGTSGPATCSAVLPSAVPKRLPATVYELDMSDNWISTDESASETKPRRDVTGYLSRQDADERNRDNSNSADKPTSQQLVHVDWSDTSSSSSHASAAASHKSAIPTNRQLLAQRSSSYEIVKSSQHLDYTTDDFAKRTAPSSDSKYEPVADSLMSLDDFLASF